MGALKLVTLQELFSALKECAPEFESRRTPHYIEIRYRGKVYFAPSGAHGKRGLRAEIEAGHLRKIVSHLEISRECVENLLPNLWGDRRSS